MIRIAYTKPETRKRRILPVFIVGSGTAYEATNLAKFPPAVGRQAPYHAAMTPTGHQVSDERHEQFRRMYERAFGEEIDIEDACILVYNCC
jgi:hypothetical protein